MYYELHEFIESVGQAHWKDDKHKEHLYYRDEIKPWQRDVWGFHVRGLGDLWYNTLRIIIEKIDKSDWAYRAFDHTLEHMIQGKRWPDKLQEGKTDHIANNRLQRIWTRLLYNMNLRATKMYREQQSMTRDPWIMLYACAIHLGRDPRTLPYPQWWLYRPRVWAWIRALKGKRNCYLLMDKVKHKKTFVQILDYFMRWSYQLNQQL